MLFYRASAPAAPMTLRTARILSLAALLAYPAGALTVNFAGAALPGVALGYALVLVSLTSAAALINSPLQRIVGEVPDRLDEYEMQVRSRAMALSYNLFTALVLAAVIFAAIASDHGGWVPTTYPQFNGLFWGAFLLATVLPVACLSWQLDASFDGAQ